jgi:hypothetical protein
VHRLCPDSLPASWPTGSQSGSHSSLSMDAQGPGPGTQANEVAGLSVARKASKDPSWVSSRRHTAGVEACGLSDFSTSGERQN